MKTEKKLWIEIILIKNPVMRWLTGCNWQMTGFHRNTAQELKETKI